MSLSLHVWKYWTRSRAIQMPSSRRVFQHGGVHFEKRRLALKLSKRKILATLMFTNTSIVVDPS